MAAIDDLKANVDANTSVTQSAITLLGNLKTEFDAAIASGDLSQVQALSDQIGKNDTDLSQAIAANTPAAPAAGSADAGQQHESVVIWAKSKRFLTVAVQFSVGSAIINIPAVSRIIFSIEYV